MEDISSNYKNSIADRERMCEELAVLVSDLSYDLNPIGPCTASFHELTKKVSLADIEEILLLVNKIKQSLLDNDIL